MSYLGRGLEQVDNISKLDNITFNGGTTYALTKDSAAFTPISSNAILISIDGVVQQGNFSVSGTNIVFNFSPTSSNNCKWILHMGTGVAFTPADSSVTKDKANFISTSSAAGLQIKGDGTTDGTLQLNCSQNSHGVKIKSPAHSAGQSYTLTLPTTSPASNKIMQTDGSGNLSFVDAPSGDFVRLNSVTGTGLSDITFDNFSSTYQVYKILGSHTMSVDDAQTRMRVRKSATDQTSSHYRFAFAEPYRSSGGSGISYNTTWNGDHVRITQGSSSADAHPTGFEFTIYSPSDSTRQSACFLESFFYESGGNNIWKAWIGSVWLDSTTGVDITGIKFYPESGNFNNAKYSIYALKDS